MCRSICPEADGTVGSMTYIITRQPVLRKTKGTQEP
jgi:hypothetical protein